MLKPRTSVWGMMKKLSSLGEAIRDHELCIVHYELRINYEKTPDISHYPSRRPPGAGLARHAYAETPR